MDNTVFVSKEKLESMIVERQVLKEEKIPIIAKRIDEAKQLGDLSENAEYHAARDEMAWAQSRILELDHIMQNAQVVSASAGSSTVQIGSTIFVSIKDKKREFTIVGGQEADPINGKISNESPLGNAFLGRKVGDKVSVTTPAGTMLYTIESIS